MSDDFATRMQRLGDLLEQLEQTTPPEALEPARALLRAALDVHQSGLQELLAALSESSQGKALVSHLCTRPSLAALFAMHDLHPESFEERVESALAQANREAQAGTHVALMSIEGERVHVRIVAAEAGKAQLLRRVFERLAGERVPEALLDIEGGEVHDRGEQLVPLSRLQTRAKAVSP